MYDDYLACLLADYLLGKGARSQEFGEGFTDNLKSIMVGDGMLVENRLKYKLGTVERDAYRSGVQAGLAQANACRGQRGLLDAFEDSRQGLELRREQAG